MELWILAAVWAVVGTPFVLIARRVFARDHLAAQWPRAPGVITDSSMSSRSARRRDDHGNDIEYTAYSFDVHYTYTVAGRTLQGDRVERERFETDQGGAQRVIDRYPRGRQIEVLYDPNDPTFALLEVKRSTGAVILLVMGCFFLALALLFLGLAVFVKR